MSERLSATIDILDRLVGFETISGRPTHAIVDYISGYLESHGLTASLSYDEDGERANVFATIGPQVDGGVVLNGHTDVVPVEGQLWQTDPFKLTRKDGRLYGRGAVDMKGFLACVLGAVPTFKAANLKRPVHIAFSYDEETGGYGMPVLLDDMAGKTFRPAIVIVGEPTGMQIVSGHKGGYEMRTEITGLETHSCNPLNGVNAISYAVRLISHIEEKGCQLAAKPYPKSPYEPPYATFNIGTIDGGSARNATAGACAFDWELRPMPGEDGAAIIADIERFAAGELLPQMRKGHPGADIRVITEAPVPPLDDRNAATAIEFVCELTGQNSHGVVSFGTDAGYFSNAGYSTVVFGPGSIDRAHKPGEYIEEHELAAGLDFMQRIADRLSR
ncbi:MAG: acetylornithine deacetylase [Aestuariivirgaceae bacterium]